MPFQSEAQRRFLWMHHPEVAKKWAHEYPGQHDLPMHKDKHQAVRVAMKARLSKKDR